MAVFRTSQNKHKKMLFSLAPAYHWVGRCGGSQNHSFWSLLYRLQIAYFFLFHWEHYAAALAKYILLHAACSQLGGSTLSHHCASDFDSLEHTWYSWYINEIIIDGNHKNLVCHLLLWLPSSVGCGLSVNQSCNFCNLYSINRYL